MVEQGKKSYLGWPDAFVIVAFGFFCVVLLAGWPPIPQFNWNALGAIGSAAAAIGAVGVAWWGWRERENDKMQRSKDLAKEELLTRTRLVQVASQSVNFSQIAMSNAAWLVENRGQGGDPEQAVRDLHERAARIESLIDPRLGGAPILALALAAQCLSEAEDIFRQAREDGYPPAWIKSMEEKGNALLSHAIHIASEAMLLEERCRDAGIGFDA